MIISKNHHSVIKNDLKTEFADEWDKIVKYYIAQYLVFYEYYMTLLTTTDIPIYIIRFEEKLKRKEEIMTEVFRFVLG